MGPLLFLTCVFLHLARSTHSAESGVRVSAGGDERISCALDIEDPVLEWRWAPRYPRCVTTGSKEVVIASPTVDPTEDGKEPFHGRLMVLGKKRELMLQNTRVNDSGTFYCIGEGNTSSSVTLSVSHDCNPAPTQASDELGELMKLSCCNNREKMEAKHPVMWLLNGKTVHNSSGIRILRNGAVTITELGPEHRGLWRCLDNEGKVMVELCLEVTAEEQDANVASQPISAPPGGHSTRGAAAKPAKKRLVWGIAGVLAAVLFILLMIGIYCCLRRQKMRTATSKKSSGAMEDVKPAGRRHGEDKGATGESTAGPPRAQSPQGAEGQEEIHYSLLEFHMAEGRAETPRAPESSPVYSEVLRKT